jgi:hypothetical protein
MFHFMLIRKLLIALNLVLLLSVLFAPQVSFAACGGNSPTPTNATGLGSVPNPAPCINNLTDVIVLIRNFIFAIIGVVVAGVVIYAGFTYMTAQGEPDQIKKAQSILLYTVIGVGVIALSVVIVQIVASVLGVNVGNILSF